MTATFAATSPACPRCGRALPADAPAGLCPRCLLSDGFGGQSEPNHSLRTGDGRRFVPPTIDELAAEFPHLEFVRLLGSGGMGAVYLAKQVRLDRQAAVKILPPDLADDPAFAERFLREARALARLSHPNIVGVFDFGQTPGGLYYFLMEYIDGPTLRQVVASRSAAPQQALEIVRQVCDALQYAHDKGIVHRDIKPENILLDAQGRPKIADFGLAKLLGLAEPHAGSPAAGALTHTKQAMGTPHYMAPEQIFGSRGVDHRADIYSLGVVFYELLTGELPLGRFAPPSRKVQIDVRLDDVVLRALESEPSQRYQHASEVKWAVESISSDPAGRPVPPVAPAVRYARQATAWAGQVAATVLEPAGPGRMSPKAIAGLIWPAAVPMALLCFVTAAANNRNDLIEIPFAALGFFFAIAGAASVVGAPILGASAIRDIRASRGEVSGLVPAVAAQLALLLFVIDAAIACAFGLPVVLLDGHPRFLMTGALFSLPLLIWVDRQIVRAAWGGATAGLPPEVVERELAVIPPPVRAAGRAVSEWFDAAWAAVSGSSRADGARPARDGFPGGLAATPPVPGETALSRKALVGILLAPCPLVFLLVIFVAEGLSGRAAPHHPLSALVTSAAWLLALPAVAAPFATTVLGWLAVGDIRRSRGRLTGLGLAVADGLIYPLLLVDLVIGTVVAGATAAVASALGLFPPQSGRVLVIALPLFGFVVTAAVWAVVDALVVRAVWRRVSRGTEPAAAPAMIAPTADAAPRFSGKAAAGAVWVAVGLIGALGVMLIAGHMAGRPVGNWVIDPSPVELVLLLLFAAAPFVATVLGWLAAGDIRRSAGRLTGLPLAVFALLAFPLLALDAVVCVATAAVWGLVWHLIRPDEASVLVALAGVAASVILVVIVDVLIVRAVWRRFRQAPVTGPQAPVTGPQGPDEAGRGRRELWMGLAVGSVGIALLLAKVWMGARGGPLEATPEPPAPPSPYTGGPDDVSESGGSPPAEEDPNRHWHRGPGGPELSHFWAEMALGVTPETEAEINAALRDTVAEYDRLLDAHMKTSFEGDTVTFTIAPFPAELDRLTNRFYGRIDPLLNREQQSIFRYNFPLRYGTVGEQDIAARYENSLMPLGSDPNGYGASASVRIERSGQWYRWRVTLPDMGTGTDSPELPDWLRPFQNRYDLLAALRAAGEKFDPGRPPLIAPKPPAPTFGEIADDPNCQWAVGDQGVGFSELFLLSLGLLERPGPVPTGTMANWVQSKIPQFDEWYERLLDVHTTVAREGNGVRFTVEPFPEDLDRVEEQFFARLGEVLDGQTLERVRREFRLRAEPSAGGFTAADLSGGSLFNAGDVPFSLTVEQNPDGYRWTLHRPFAASGASRRLPLALRRWEKRLAAAMEAGG